MYRRPASGLNFTTPRDCFSQFTDLARKGPGYFCVIEAGRQAMISTIVVWSPRKMVDGGKKNVGGLVISRGALSGLPLRAPTSVIAFHDQPAEVLFTGLHSSLCH